MKRSSPLIILVALTLAALSYGGKQAENPVISRAPASVSSAKPPVKSPDLKPPKNGQDPVVIAEFPPLEIEEIH
jgi:hypothetical protein